MSCVILVFVPHGSRWPTDPTVTAEAEAQGGLAVWLDHPPRPGQEAVFRIDEQWGDGNDDQDVFEERQPSDLGPLRLTTEGAQRLAVTVGLLAEQLDSGWGLQLCWIEDPDRTGCQLTSASLVDHVLASSLDRFTRYVVVEPDT